MANEWDEEKLIEWGLDLPNIYKINESDLFNINIPFYTPSGEKPKVDELANFEKVEAFKNRIDRLNISDGIKQILIARAYFFTDFNFDKVADYFCEIDGEEKEIFKDLGMVIIAPEEALKKGFVEISENILEL